MVFVHDLPGRDGWVILRRLCVTVCATDVGAASLNEPIRLQSENLSRRDYVRAERDGRVRLHGVVRRVCWGGWEGIGRTPIPQSFRTGTQNKRDFPSNAYLQIGIHFHLQSLGKLTKCAPFFFREAIGVESGLNQVKRLNVCNWRITCEVLIQ